VNGAGAPPASAPAAPLTATSIVDRLTHALVLWVGGIWLVCVLGVAWYVQREIRHNFDSEMRESAHRMIDVAVGQLDLDDLPGPGDPPVIAPPPLIAGDAVVYQLVDIRGRVLMRPQDAPARPFGSALTPGYSTAPPWRVFTVRHPTLPLMLRVAEPLSDRRKAVQGVLLGLILPMIGMLPLLAWTLRGIARRELRTLQRIETEIGQRGSNDLRSITLDGLPRELRSMAEHVNHLLVRLGHALDVERALSANAAHELRTPLAATRLRLQTALDHTIDRADVQAAVDSLGVLSQRTEKLLQFSRAESAGSLNQAPVDLVQLAAVVAQDFWQTDAGRQRVALDVPDDDLPAALGDFDTLAIALRNLVENALRYSTGRVEIEVAAPCSVRVRDHGPGVPAHRLRSMRQRHVRHSEDQAGYGLGLSIVTTIVERHHGRLELLSPLPDGRPGFEARLELPPQPSASDGA
jgi:two-component system OmpR family sensor kinase